MKHFMDLGIYTESADIYDDFELRGKSTSDRTNQKIINILEKYSVKSVLDMSCGTGAQAIALARKGFDVTASDLSREMIEITKIKSKGLAIQFNVGDMQYLDLGNFDAVISMFNSVGHLTKEQLLKTLVNAKRNLNKNGLLIFDIFNKDVMPLLPRHKFIDQARDEGNKFLIRFTQFDFNRPEGVLNTKQTLLVQKGIGKTKTINREYDLLTYKRKELKLMLGDAGYHIVDISDHGLADFADLDNPLVNMLMHLVVAVKLD